MDTQTLVDFIVAICFALCGFAYLAKPAEFGTNKGFSTRFSRKNEETWNFAQKAAGTVYLIFAAVLTLINFALRSIFGPETSTYSVVNIVIELGFVVLSVVVVNALLRKKFPD